MSTNRVINRVTDQVARTHAPAIRRKRSRTIAATGATVFVGATLTLGAIALSDDHAARPAPTAPQRPGTGTQRDLVERGLIPREALEPAPAWHAELLGDLAERDLVARGLIPRESLDPAPVWHAELLGDLAERDLVARGLIPPQSLEPDPALASPAG